MIPESTLRAIEHHFHEVIRGRAGDLVDEHTLELPRLTGPVGSAEEMAWLAIPGMYGGFAYRLEGESERAMLTCESWCRVVLGSGERHEVTATGSRLVAEGFV